MRDYRELSDDELLALLFTEEDRFTCDAVEEFIRRGERMIKPLSEIVSEQYSWTKTLPEWWAVVHATFILGAIGGKEVVLPLLRGMRWAVSYDCDWVTEELPSIFGKIETVAIDDLKQIAKDRTSDWFTRSMPIEGLAAITIYNPEVGKDIFSFINSILKDSSEDRAVRQTAGSVLIDFMRVEYKEDLLAFGREEQNLRDEDSDYLHSFSDNDVEKWFSGEKKDLWFYIKDWLSFYNEDEIRKRQERWKKEEEQAEDETEDEMVEDDDYDPEPIIRESAKIGRNAPCPCGSGKKYKKCCIDKMTWN